MPSPSSSLVFGHTLTTHFMGSCKHPFTRCCDEVIKREGRNGTYGKEKRHKWEGKKIRKVSLRNSRSLRITISPRWIISRRSFSRLVIGRAGPIGWNHKVISAFYHVHRCFNFIYFTSEIDTKKYQSAYRIYIKRTYKNSPVVTSCCNLEGRSAVVVSAPWGWRMSGMAFLLPVRPVSRNSFGTSSLFLSCIIAIILKTEIQYTQENFNEITYRLKNKFVAFRIKNYQIHLPLFVRKTSENDWELYIRKQ